MCRATILLGLVAVVGCGPDVTTTPSRPPSVNSVTSESISQVDSGSESNDRSSPTTTSAHESEFRFAEWPMASDGPYAVPPALATRCIAPPSRIVRGPHFQAAIIVRVHPKFIEPFKRGEAPMPVGTTVIKEKHDNSEATGAPKEYAAMFKREPGYDAEHGDWEYLYATLAPEQRVRRGRMASCIECHEQAADTDYLFRTYVPSGR